MTSLQVLHKLKTKIAVRNMRNKLLPIKSRGETSEVGRDSLKAERYPLEKSRGNLKT